MVVEELEELIEFFPLLNALLIQKLSTRIYFSASCKTGDGVQYADMSPHEVWNFKENFAETRAHKVWYSSLLSPLSHKDNELSFTSSCTTVTKRPLKVSKPFKRVIEWMA